MINNIFKSQYYEIETMNNSINVSNSNDIKKAKEIIESFNKKAEKQNKLLKKINNNNNNNSFNEKFMQFTEINNDFWDEFITSNINLYKNMSSSMKPILEQLGFGINEIEDYVVNNFCNQNEEKLRESLPPNLKNLAFKSPKELGNSFCKKLDNCEYKEITMHQIHPLVCGAYDQLVKTLPKDHPYLETYKQGMKDKLSDELNSIGVEESEKYSFENICENPDPTSETYVPLDPCKSIDPIIEEEYVKKQEEEERIREEQLREEERIREEQLREYHRLQEEADRAEQEYQRSKEEADRIRQIEEEADRIRQIESESVSEYTQSTMSSRPEQKLLDEIEREIEKATSSILFQNVKIDVNQEDSTNIQIEVSEKGKNVISLRAVSKNNIALMPELKPGDKIFFSAGDPFRELRTIIDVNNIDSFTGSEEYSQKISVKLDQPLENNHSTILILKSKDVVSADVDNNVVSEDVDNNVVSEDVDNNIVSADVGNNVVSEEVVSEEVVSEEVGSEDILDETVSKGLNIIFILIILLIAGFVLTMSKK